MRQLFLLFPGGERSGGRVLVRGRVADGEGEGITAELLSTCSWWMGGGGGEGEGEGGEGEEHAEVLLRRMRRKLGLRPEAPPHLRGRWSERGRNWYLRFRTEDDLRRAIRTLQFARGVWMPLGRSGVSFKTL